MKRIISLLAVLLAAVVSQAENSFTVDAISIQPGEEKTIAVTLTNEEAKSAAIDITLPEGLSFVGENGSVTFTSRADNMGNKSAKIQTSGALRVGLAFGTIAAGSGELFSFKVKADENATLGAYKMKFTSMKLTNSASQKVTIADSEVDVTVYKLYKVEVTANTAEMGSVSGGGDAVMSGTSTTVTATANEGYSFVNWTEGSEVVSTESSLTFDVTANRSLTANFKANQYTSTFILGNGQENVVKTQDYKSALTAPENPTLTGYTFKGWTPEVPATVPVGDQTYTAQWQINQYTMTFKLGNGQDDIVKKQDYDSALDKPADPQREGYTFTGWDAEIPAKIPAEDKTFTAQWQINQYKMTFVLGNGQEDMVKTQDYATTLEAPANLVKTGYTFTGWTPEVPQAVPAGDQTYTAQWQINQYTMTFVLGNGEEDIVVKQDYNTALQKPADPQREGYTFKGWDTEIPATIPAEDKTFTAQWQINQYKMTFVLGNGQEDVVKTQDYATTLEAPANLVKTGYTFTGWTPEVPQAVPAGDQTYTAQWQINQYTMTFKLGNGQDDIVKKQDYDSALDKPADPQREGYTFKGWDAEIPAKIPAEDKTFTAQWQINQYKMTFVLGNGQEDVVKTQDYGTTLEAPANLVKTGYTFTGWTPEVPQAVPAGDQTYTAQWQINQYTMTFKLGNGQDDIVKTQDYDSALDKPADPQREGYTFKGWDAEIPAKIPAEDKTFTAQWQVNQYTMTFVLDNGEENVVKTQDYGTDLTAPADLVKTGYTFTGWTPEVPQAVPAGDQTYTAQWQINQYTMTFKLGNGQDDIVKKQDYDSALDKPADPQREGYTFKGWDAEIPAKIPAEDKTFTAQWQVNQYTMTFVLDNGEENVVKTQDYGTDLTAPADLVKTGYTFTGWTPEVPQAVPAGDQTYTAQWQINQYTMTFKLGNGQDDIVKTQDYDSALDKPADPQREGYTFTGWDAEIPATIPAEDKTFTAQWQINQYKMTFVLGNGQEDVVKTQDYATTLEAPANLVKTGYTFTGWTPEVPQAVPAGDQTYTAQWQINQYTMTFKLGNGQDDIVKKQDYDSALDKPADPQREGYTFKGWDKEIPATIPGQDMTFTAQWEINQYKMTFKPENGEADVEKTQDYGTELTAPADLQRTGYTFKGWSPEVPATVPAEDKTFTAQWQINQYTMTFVLGNGEADIVKTQDYQTALEKPADPQREGYTFTGWDKEIPATIPAEDMTFTAQWEINQYKMTFKPENGEADVEKTQDYGTELTAPADLQRTGYTFKGWSPEVPATVPAEDKTFTAQWQINQYTMTFVLGNGEADIVKTQDYQTALEKPADPQREGYTFTGWSPEVPATIPGQDMTFTAQWEINQYKMTFKLENGEADVEKTQDYGTELTAPADLQRTGYTFKGWSPEVPATVPAEDKTYTAQWQINQYTMTFVLGNGEADIVKTLDYQTALEKPADPQREGYTFKGWDKEIPATIPAEDMTFTAQWQVNKYKVTFIVDGQTVKEEEVEYGAPIEKPADPQKDTYTFIGWTPEVPATMPASDMTFTAQFALNPYTMTFVLGNGEADIVKTQECGSELTPPADPTREGYTFTGWSPEVPATVPGENMTFTAQWQVNQYAVIYMVNGQEWARDMVDYGAAITLREYEAAVGETFTGWAFDGGETYTTMPAHDVVVIATIFTGVDGVVSGGSPVDVYDLSGRKVLRHTTTLKGLRKGVYIINGRKVVLNPVR